MMTSALAWFAVAYSYIRFSHPDQRRGNSLRRQLNRSHRYCEENALRLDDTIQDLARSAFHNAHTVTGNLGVFLTLVRAGDIKPGSYLLIESFDRLSRDEFWPAFDLIREIFQARINIVTLPDDDEVHEYSYDAINKNPTLIHEIINDLTRAHRESKLKSARCRDACEMQREEAFAGLAKIPGRCPAWLKPIRGTILVQGDDGEWREKNATIGFTEIPLRVEIIRLIFDWAHQGCGCEAIAKRLNRDPNHKIAFGHRDGWHKRTVYLYLRNPQVMGWKLTGKMVNGQWIKDATHPIKDHFPQIIDPDLFYLVQGEINDRKTGAASGRIGKKLPNLLRGIAICHSCGKPLHYVSIGERFPSQRYLICSRAKRSVCENDTHYTYDPLEAELLTILPLIDLSRLTRRSDSEAEHGRALEAQIAEMSEQLTALARRKQSTEIENVIDELTDELAALRGEYAAWSETHRIVEAQASQDRHTQFVGLVTQMACPNLDDDKRLSLRSRIAAELRRLIESAVAQDDSITIKFKPATHQQIELRLVKQTVESLTLWSRSENAVDFPQNPMRRLIAFPRSMLVDGTVPAEQFAAYTAGGA